MSEFSVSLRNTDVLYKHFLSANDDGIPYFIFVNFPKKNVCKNVEASVEFDSKSFNPRQKIFVSPRENELFPARHEEMWHGWTLPRGGGGRGRRRRRASLVPGHRSRHRTGTGAKVKATDDRGYHRVDKRGMTFGAEEHLQNHNNALQ